MKQKCKYHGMSDHATRKRGGYRCRKCASESVTRRRRVMKKVLVKEFGGKCIRCGYTQCIAALQFHHRNPKEKEFRLSQNSTKSLTRMREEAKKCDLLCANCHMEEHYRLEYL